MPRHSKQARRDWIEAHRPCCFGWDDKTKEYVIYVKPNEAWVEIARGTSLDEATDASIDKS